MIHKLTFRRREAVVCKEHIKNKIKTASFYWADVTCEKCLESRKEYHKFGKLDRTQRLEKRIKVLETQMKEILLKLNGE